MTVHPGEKIDAPVRGHHRNRDLHVLADGDLPRRLQRDRVPQAGLAPRRSCRRLIERKIVAVKSTNHFRAAFGPIAKKVIYIDSDGPLSRDYRKIPYTRVQRPIWPLDPETSPGLVL
jgi:microcystin degradation protein MlrC